MINRSHRAQQQKIEPRMLADSEPRTGHGPRLR